MFIKPVTVKKIKYTAVQPLPILLPSAVPFAGAILCYTDVSGHLLSSPSLGIYIPSQTTESPLVASLSLPRSFLNKVDNHNQIIQKMIGA